MGFSFRNSCPISTSPTHHQQLQSIHTTHSLKQLQKNSKTKNKKKKPKSHDTKTKKKINMSSACTYLTAPVYPAENTGLQTQKPITKNFVCFCGAELSARNKTFYHQHAKSKKHQRGLALYPSTLEKEVTAVIYTKLTRKLWLKEAKKATDYYWEQHPEGDAGQRKLPVVEVKAHTRKWNTDLYDELPYPDGSGSYYKCKKTGHYYDEDGYELDDYIVGQIEEKKQKEFTDKLLRREAPKKKKKTYKLYGMEFETRLEWEIYMNQVNPSYFLD